MEYSPPEPLWDIVEEHLDEAEFLWEMWEHSLIAPNYTLDEVAKGPEERLLAHIDGLVVNGPMVAERLLIPALEHDEPGRVSAAATALLLGPLGDRGFQLVLEALRDLPAQRPAIVRALSCVDLPDVLPRLQGILTDHDRAIARAAAEVFVFRFASLGEALGRLLRDDDPSGCALGLKALQYAPEAGQHRGFLDAALLAAEPIVQDAAIETGALLGMPTAWARARVRSQERDGGPSLLLLALRGDPDDHALLMAALQDPERRHAALWALGFLGTPEAVDACLEWLDDIAMAPLAGEVFEAVTGISIDDENLTLQTRHDEDEDLLDHAPEDDLPRPDPMLVRERWAREHKRLEGRQRYLAGSLLSADTCSRHLSEGVMRRRPAVSLSHRLLTGIPQRLRLRSISSHQRSDLTGLEFALRSYRREIQPMPKT